jgi:hypothetical protein
VQVEQLWLKAVSGSSALSLFQQQLFGLLCSMVCVIFV